MDQESKDGAEEKERKCREHGGRVKDEEEQEGRAKGFVQGQSPTESNKKRE